MRGWYNIHDQANKRFGFVPYPGSVKTKPPLVTIENNGTGGVLNAATSVSFLDLEYFGYSISTIVTFVVITVIAVVSIVILILFVCYYMLSKPLMTKVRP